MNKSDELLEKCFKCKSYQENDCGIYFMMALWQTECKFIKIMKTKYQQFLEDINVISEEKFNEIINSLPEVNIENIDFGYVVSDSNDEDEIACIIIDSVLERFNYVYVENVNFSDRRFSLADVESLEDLEEIKNIFSNWTIDNYDELLKELEEEEKSNEENSEREKLILSITNNATIDQLRKFVNDL